MSSLIAKIAPQSQLSQIWPPKPTFLPERDIPDLTGKVALVTGGNSGVGYETVKQLLLKNAKVYLAGRSPNKCEEAVKQLKEETKGKEPVTLQLDLADLNSIREAAKEFLDKEKKLDYLFNNGGVMVPPINLLTAQNYDLQFGTNVIGHYFLTILLMPALERSTEENKVKARVINVSSNGQHMAPGPTGINWKVLKGGEERDKALQKLGYTNFGNSWQLYGMSKLGNVLLSNILVRYYGDKVASCSLNPGNIKTGLQQHLSMPIKAIVRLSANPPRLGALTQLWAGTTLPVEEMDGKYMQPWARFSTPDHRSMDGQIQDELKTWLEEQVKGF